MVRVAEERLAVGDAVSRVWTAEEGASRRSGRGDKAANAIAQKEEEGVSVMRERGTEIEGYDVTAARTTQRAEARIAGVAAQ